MTEGRTIESPWPGPRPFTEEEGELLFSRDADLGKVGAAIRTRQVVQLSARSGAGKTSFIQAKLIPAMRKSGYLPLLHRAWGAAGLRADERHGADRGVSLYHAALRAAVESEIKAGNSALQPLTGASTDDDLRALLAMKSAGPKGVVLLFDQVEELLRRDATAGMQFIREVTRVATQYPLQQLVSLRNEYVASLLPMHGDLGSLAAQSIEMEELVDETSLRAIIMRPPALPQFGVTVSEDAYKEILAWWTEARQLQTDAWSAQAERSAELAAAELGATNVGLLHLQGVLWSLYRSWSDPNNPHHARNYAHGPRPADTRKITTKTDVQRFAKDLVGDYEGSAGKSSVVPIVAESLFRWVESAFEPLEHDKEREWRRETTRDMAARMAIHLSAGGFKNTQTVDQLATLCIAEDLSKLGVGSENLADVLPRLVEGLGDDEDERLEDLNERLTGVAKMLDSELKVDESLAAFDRIAGPIYLQWADQIRGRTLPQPGVDSVALRATATELLVGFGLASYYLRAAHILREPPSMGTTRLVELVHDGFGPAFTRWAKKYGEGPGRSVRSLVAIAGRDLVWDSITEESAGAAEVKGLCWVGCWIAAPGRRRVQISGITFEDCNFKGSVFTDVDFTDTKFTNCSLKGAIFQRCTFKGVEFDDGVFDGAVIRDVTLVRPALDNKPTFSNVTANNITFEAVGGGPWSFDRINVLHGLFRAGDKKASLGIEVKDSVLTHWHLDATAFARCSISKSLLLYLTTGDGAPYLSIDDSELVGVYVPDGVLKSYERNEIHPAPEVGGDLPELKTKPAGVADPWRMGR